MLVLRGAELAELATATIPELPPRITRRRTPARVVRLPACQFQVDAREALPKERADLQRAMPVGADTRSRGPSPGVPAQSR